MSLRGGNITNYNTNNSVDNYSLFRNRTGRNCVSCNADMLLVEVTLFVL